MPRNEKKSVLLRQWEMLKLLPVNRSNSKSSTHWAKASEIARQLNDCGYDVSIRTVQRDLHELSEVFQIELNDKNPRDYGWRWLKDANLDIPGLSMSEALAMRMLEMHLKPMLPSTMLESLEGLFTSARRKLDEVRTPDNPTKAWLDKVRVVAPTQPLLPPVVDSDVQDSIYQAVLAGRQIEASYRPMSSDSYQTYRLNPLGLIMRGPITYLVATAWDYEDARLYALHRFDQIEVLYDAVKVPEGFNLDDEVARGLAEFTDEKKSPIQIELRCTEGLASHLAETPISTDQRIEPDRNGWVKLSATVNDTWQLRWWILGQGAGIEILSPKALRDEIRIQIRQMLKIYGSAEKGEQSKYSRYSKHQ